MDSRNAVLLSSFMVLIACQAEIPTDIEESNSVSVLPFSSLEESAALEDYLREHGLAPGNWRYEDVARICDGYMTRFEDEIYCASEVPDDWVPFEFDGQIYYVQPLGEAVDHDR